MGSPDERLDKAWLEDLRRAVDARLEEIFAREHQSAARLAPEMSMLVESVRSLTMRGGKRLRPAVLVAAFRAVEPGRDWRQIIDAGCALELMQTYLLIHDDWMDGDDQRRGGPAVHAALRDRVGDAHLGASLAVLAGDLASAYAQELMFAALPSSARPNETLRAFAEMQVEVVLGQGLDMIGTADVSRMQQLKTGSYTVAGPLKLGALLGGASEAQLETLLAFGRPLGEAFQVRDDLLGTFGDPKATGKPAGNDIRAGKRTALVLECERLLPASAREALTRAFGRKDATDDEVAAATALLARSGARVNVEARLDQLLTQASAALEDQLRDPGRSMLRQIASALAVRDR